MPTNKAAFVALEPQKHIEIQSVSYPSPGPFQIVIRNNAVGINPIDWMLPIFGAFQHIKWPFVLGSDSAGEVVELGSKITRFKRGDRVVGQAIGYDAKVNKSAESSFQTFTILNEDMTARLPDNISYEAASVLPLGIGTAACGLFQQNLLALQRPSLNVVPRGQTVIVWGGSTSVGSNAIQLAVAAGYQVVTTSSNRNLDYCKSLGATHCFDYSAKSTKQNMISLLKGKPVAGVIMLDDQGVETTLEVLKQCSGERAIAMVAFPKPPSPPQRLVTLQTAFYFIRFMVSMNIKARGLGIRWGFVNGTDLAHNDLCKSIYSDFLEPALARGMYQCKPDPLVTYGGLEKLQNALDTQKKGVSAKKVVLSLST